MQIFNCNYYISISILCKLFFQNQALENNARSEDKVSASLALIQNYEPLRNFVKRGTIISSITEIKETENLEKRETKKSKKSKRKVVKKKKSKKSIKKKPLKNKTKKPSKKKTKKSLSKKSSSKKPTSKKPSSKSPTKTTERIITTKIQKSRKSPTSTIKSNELEQLKLNLYEQINFLRWEYRAEEFKINNTLAELAQDLTDRFAKKKLKNLEVELKNIQSKKKISFGALFYYVKASDKYKPFSKWTLGAPFIDLRYPERFPSGGDFTLLIWSSSTQIGCGISKHHFISTIVTICLVYPKGNIKGQFAENIHRARYKIYFPQRG